MINLDLLSQQKVNRVFNFLRGLNHTKGVFYGKCFDPLPWQSKIIWDVYGTLRPNGYRQYKNVYIELPKKNGKSGLLSGLGLYHLCSDGEMNAEVYGCAADKPQASLIFDVAVDMVDQNKTLKKHMKLIISSKRMVYKPTRSFYQVVSAEAYSKHGLNISCCLFDEIHAQPNRELYDVMSFGSGDARAQPIYFFITTAGQDPDRMSIGWEMHQKSENILLGKSNDKVTYSAIWGIDYENNRIWTGQNYIQSKEKIDWTDKKVWYQVNPSLGDIIMEDKIVEAYDNINDNKADEKLFKQLRLNIWVKERYTQWINLDKWLQNSFIIDIDTLKGKTCYGGLDLSSKLDITAFVLVFPPDEDLDKYTILPFFWLPEDNLNEIIKRDQIRYDDWVDKGLLKLTKGNKIDYHAITNQILRLRRIYNIEEIGFDIWNADAVSTDLDNEGLEMIEIRQNYQNLSPSMREIEALVHAKMLNHLDNEVLNWMFGNLQIKIDDNGNIRPTKSIRQGSSNKTVITKAKIDGIVAMINAFCRVIAYKDKYFTIYTI